MVRLSREGSFDSLNFAVSKGTLAAGIGLIYDTLMASSLDEIASEYGLLAEAVRYPADWSWVTYRLRRDAKWHDGTPGVGGKTSTCEEFAALKQHNPTQAFYYRHVVKAENHRRTRGDVHLRQAGQSRAAADRRSDQRAAEALVDQQGCVKGKQTRYRRHHARNSRSAAPPTRSRAS